MIVSPVPGLGTPLENADSFSTQEVGLYVDWVAYAGELLRGRGKGRGG